MSVCQYKFKNGTICGTRTQGLYCDDHTRQIMVKEWFDRIAELEATLSNERNKASAAWNAWRDKSDALESMRDELDDLRARADTLAQALKEVKDWAEWEQDKFPWYKAVDAALSDWRTARGKRGDA